MARQALIPGIGYVNETGTRQALIPGAGYINETVSASPSGFLAAWIRKTAASIGIGGR